MTWVPVNDGLVAGRVYELVIDPTNPRVLWVATEGGGVLRLDQDVVFADGFESGDTGQWSVPPG